MRSYIIDTLVMFGGARPSMNGTPQQGTLCVSLTVFILVLSASRTPTLVGRSQYLFFLIVGHYVGARALHIIFDASDNPQYQYVVFVRPVLGGPFLIGLTYLPTFLDAGGGRAFLRTVGPQVSSRRVRPFLALGFGTVAVFPSA